MTIDIDKIVSDKLAQLDRDGTIQQKIEEALEKTILSAVTEALGSWDLKRNIEKQLKDAIDSVAADCGLSAYNGFIAQKAAQIVQEQCREDIAAKVQNALESLIVKRYDSIKLSDIFERYRAWVLEYTEESEKYDRQRFTCELKSRESGSFTHYTCRFADHEMKPSPGYCDTAEIEIRFCAYQSTPRVPISTLLLDGRSAKDMLLVGRLTDVEAFLLNLYYNQTEIVLDVDNVDDDNSFDIDI